MNSRAAKRLTAALLLILCGAMSKADEPAKPTGPIPLSLNEAIRQALDHRLDVRMEETNLQIAQTKINEARGIFLPTLDLVTDTQRVKNYDLFSSVDISATVLGQPLSVSVTNNVPQYQTSAALETNWNIYAGGSDNARLDEMQANDNAAQAQRDITRQNVILEVATAYWALRKAQIEQAQAVRAAALARDEAQFAATQYEQGRLSEIDKQTKLLKATESELQEKQAQRNLHERISAFLSALGQPEQYVGSTLDDLKDDPDNIDIGALLQQGGTPTPALAKTRAEIAAARARQREESAGFYPRLDFFGRYGEIGRDQNSFDEALSDLHRQSWIVGLKLRWNLFNGRKTTERLEGARHESVLAELRMEQKQRELSQAAQTKTRRIETLQDDLELAKKRLALSQAQERIAKIRLEMDQISRLQYRSADLAVQEAADKTDLAKIDLLLARLELALASGEFSQP